jgi:hypothetical protein
MIKLNNNNSTNNNNNNNANNNNNNKQNKTKQGRNAFLSPYSLTFTTLFPLPYVRTITVNVFRQ